MKSNWGRLEAKTEFFRDDYLTQEIGAEEDRIKFISKNSVLSILFEDFSFKPIIFMSSKFSILSAS